MYEVSHWTARVARVGAPDRETAKRRFAAYVLYDDRSDIVFDVQLSFGDNAEIVRCEGDAPVSGSRDELRDWLSRRDAEAEAFEVGLFEDREQRLDAYLRLLATNDHWRLEGHGSLGKRLSAVPMPADMVTFDRRISYRFDATQFLDYLRFDVLAALDPRRPHESLRVESLIDVAALHDEGLRQIVSSYEIIANELRLTARFSSAPDPGPTFVVTFADAAWNAYIAHRAAEPARFLPPPGWTSAFPAYGEE